MNTTAVPNIDGETVNALADVRQQIKGLNDQLSALNERKQQLEGSLIRGMEAIGLKRLATDNATISVATEMMPQVTDWEAFGPYVIQNEALHLLHRRVSAAACRELTAEGEAIPGVEMHELTKLNFRTNN